MGILPLMENLEVNEEEAVAIRMIFDQYVNTDLGANGIAKYLEIR